jgi:hypothetical protein
MVGLTMGRIGSCGTIPTGSRVISFRLHPQRAGGDSGAGGSCTASHQLPFRSVGACIYNLLLDARLHLLASASGHQWPCQQHGQPASPKTSQALCPALTLRPAQQKSQPRPGQPCCVRSGRCLQALPSPSPSTSPSISPSALQPARPCQPCAARPTATCGRPSHCPPSASGCQTWAWRRPCPCPCPCPSWTRWACRQVGWGGFREEWLRSLASSEGQLQVEDCAHVSCFWSVCFSAFFLPVPELCQAVDSCFAVPMLLGPWTACIHS